jgi:hypothetical protein
VAFDCGIDDCGFIAVGTCATCGRGFCATHQGRTGGTLIVDQCSSCRLRHSQDEFVGNPWAAQEYLSNAASGDLLAAGVPLVDVHSLTRREKPTLFGGSKLVVEVAPAGRGWLLGEILWTYSLRRRSGGGEVTEQVLTVLSESGSGYDPRRGLIRVRADGDRGDYLALGGWAAVQDWAAAAARVRALAAREDSAERPATGSIRRSPWWHR